MTKRFLTKKWIGIFILAIVVLVFVISIVTGCSVGYVFHVGVGQLKIMHAREPVEKIISAPNTSPEIREKLQAILDAKRYGEETIGLKRTDSYTSYVALNRPVASWNLMAAPPLKLDPVTWWFPIVGRVPYLGYFDKAKCEKKEAELRREGYDTYLRGAGAYSTLGWFADPIFSPLMRYDIPSLVNITIHELTHTTVFLKGHVAYDEGMALFVGNQGALDYLTAKYGPMSEYVKIEQDEIHNDRVFSAFLQRLQDKLEKLYDSSLPDDQKLKEKGKIFAEAKEEFKTLPFHGEAYESFLEADLNNAAILSRAIYYVDLDMYQALYEALGKDLKKTMGFFKSLEKDNVSDPEAFTRNFIKEHKKADGN